MTFCWTVFADSSKSDVSDPCPLSAIGYRLSAMREARMREARAL
jgi:hypothetical protein